MEGADHSALSEVIRHLVYKESHVYCLRNSVYNKSEHKQVAVKLADIHGTNMLFILTKH